MLQPSDLSGHEWIIYIFMGFFLEKEMSFVGSFYFKAVRKKKKKEAVKICQSLT